MTRTTREAQRLSRPRGGFLRQGREVPQHVLPVDLPRPRDFRVLASQRYGELRREALETLYEEAVKAFAKGSKAAYDLVEAFGRRRSPAD